MLFTSTARAHTLDDVLGGVLHETLSAAGPFAALTPEARASLVASAKRSSYAAGDVIVQAGEIANAMYVVMVGYVQVYLEDAAGRAQVLAKFGPGAFFGEQALLPGRDGRRNASVRAHSNVVLARIPRAELTRTLAEASGLAERLAAVGDAQLARRLADETAQGLDLVDATTRQSGKELSLHDGAVVFRKGDEARDVYLVLRGTVGVYDEKDGSRTLLRRLSVGQCFGELALTRQQPRAATVIAEGDATVLVIDGTRFSALYDRSPALRRALETLERTYAFPVQGVVTQFNGELAGEACVTVVYELADGRSAITSLAFEREVYRLELRGPRRSVSPGTSLGASPGGSPSTSPGASFGASLAESMSHHVWQSPGGNSAREITVDAGGTIAALSSVGQWPELSLLHEAALEGRVLPDDALDAFAETGVVALHVEADPAPDLDPLCCRCTNVRRSAIDVALKEGCGTLAQLRARLGCGSICGGCVPALQELLGDDLWTVVDIVEVIPLAPDVRAFRLKPRRGVVRNFHPGQHIVIRARVDGALVDRAYTLTSPGGAADYYEVTIKREPFGLFSRWMFEKGARGVTLRVAGPQGEVCWKPSTGPVVCVVAGIGVTPALAILRARSLHGDSGSLDIHYSVRDRSTAACAEELLGATVDRGVRVTLRETGVQGRLGRADLAPLVEATPDADWYLCGPGAFLDAVAATIARLGVRPERIHLERFLHAGDLPEIAPPDPTVADDILVAPVAPPRKTLQDATIALGLRALEAYSRPQGETRPDGVTVPRTRWVGRGMLQSAGLDPALPSFMGAASTVLQGAYASQVRVFGQPSPFVANREIALAALARGAPLAPNTPDGDTFTDVVPAVALPQFEGARGVDTGWLRTAEGPLLPIVCTRAPSAIRAILKDLPTADRGPVPYHYVQQAMGIPRGCPRDGGPAGLFSGCYHGNATWTRDRATAVDHLTPSELERTTPVLTASLRDMEAAMSAMIVADPGRVVDLGVMMRKVAFRLVMRVLLGRGDDRAVVAMGDAIVAAVNKGLQQIAPLSLGLPGHAKIFAERIADARSVVARMVEQVRARSAAGELTSHQEQLPVVQRLLESVDGTPVSVDRLHTLMLPLVIAGHETSAHALSWAFYHLSRDPELARCVRAESDGYRAWRGGGAMRHQDFDRRPWMLALFLEVTRLYALLPFVTRFAREAGEISPNPRTGIGGFRYPKGTGMLVSILGAHLDPETYPDPLAFRPQRFLEGIDPALPAHRRGRAVRQRAWDLESSGSLVGFGMGPAECPGRGMATFEFFLVVDHLFGRFDFDLVDPTRDVQVSKELLSAPERPGGLAARIRRRADVEAMGTYQRFS